MPANPQPARLSPGTPVTFTFYGEQRAGRVTRDNGTGVVWVEDGRHELWMHRESLHVTPSGK